MTFPTLPDRHHHTVVAVVSRYCSPCTSRSMYPSPTWTPDDTTSLRLNRNTGTPSAARALTNSIPCELSASQTTNTRTSTIVTGNDLTGLFAANPGLRITRRRRLTAHLGQRFRHWWIRGFTANLSLSAIRGSFPTHRRSPGSRSGLRPRRRSRPRLGARRRGLVAHECVHTLHSYRLPVPHHTQQRSLRLHPMNGSGLRRIGRGVVDRSRSLAM